MRPLNFTLSFTFLIISFTAALSQTGVESDSTGLYLNSYSYNPGDSIQVYANLPDGQYEFKIIFWNSQKTAIQTFSEYVKFNKLNSNVSSEGCNWQKLRDVQIPSSWDFGFYTIEAKLATGEFEKCFFILRPPENQVKNPILFNLSIFTYIAYNTFGGKSNYDQYSSDNQRTFTPSLKRPFAGSGTGFWEGHPYTTYHSPRGEWEQILYMWLNKKSLGFDLSTDIDLATKKIPVDKYKVIILAGHSEYWDQNMRNTLEDYVKNGGNLIVFSGNNCWWRVRFDATNQRIISYKNYLQDPEYSSNPSNATDLWFRFPINQPESSFLGSSYRFGGRPFPIDSTYGGYTVIRDDSWIFKGTKMGNGNRFGYKYLGGARYATISGYEIDGLPFKFNNGTFFPNFESKDENDNNIPLGIQKIIKDFKFTNTDSIGFGSMLLKKLGKGWVFNGSTIQWSYPLDKNTFDPVTEAVTLNIINAFSENKIPATIQSYSPYLLKSIFSNRMEVFVRSRNLKLPVKSTTTFHVEIVEQENYLTTWVKNSEILEKDTISYSYKSEFQTNSPDTLKCIISNKENQNISTSVQWVVEPVPGKTEFISYTPSMNDSVLFPGNESLFEFPENLRNKIKDVYIISPSWAFFNPKSNSISLKPERKDLGKSKLNFICSDLDSILYQYKISLKVITDSAVHEKNGIQPMRIQINPNPATTEFSFSVLEDSDLPGSFTVSIYTILGQNIFGLNNYDPKTSRIHLNGFSNGMYFVKVTGIKDGKTFSGKTKLIVLH